MSKAVIFIDKSLVKSTREILKKASEGKVREKDGSFSKGEAKFGLSEIYDSAIRADMNINGERPLDWLAHNVFTGDWRKEYEDKIKRIEANPIASKEVGLEYAELSAPLRKLYSQLEDMNAVKIFAENRQRDQEKQGRYGTHGNIVIEVSGEDSFGPTFKVKQFQKNLLGGVFSRKVPATSHLEDVMVLGDSGSVSSSSISDTAKTKHSVERPGPPMGTPSSGKPAGHISSM